MAERAGTTLDLAVLDEVADPFADPQAVLDEPPAGGPVLDLFAGPGGWDTGAGVLGLAPVGIEFDADACHTGAAAGHVRHQADVASCDPAATTLWTTGTTRPSGLIASPPCQSFSMAGKGRGRAGRPVLLEAVARIGSGEDPAKVILAVDEFLDDPRAALVLEPLRWALALEPEWVALEQVGPVLALWEAVGTVLQAAGYSVDVGMLHAEEYGVPQTRKRAFLVANRTRSISLPAPTHRRYRKGITQAEGDQSLLPWVSMADALGWAGWDRIGFPRRFVADTPNRVSLEIDGSLYRERDLRQATVPAQVVTEKARSWSRWRLAPPAPFRSEDRTKPRDLEEPSLTVAFGNNAAGWQWQTDVPDVGPVRVTVEEAAVLQTFRPDYPFSGAMTSRFRQVGDAVPPVLATAVLASTLGVAA